jgi:hypothetical protein
MNDRTAIWMLLTMLGLYVFGVQWGWIGGIGRYQMLAGQHPEVNGTLVWRLDTKTGDMAICWAWFDKGGTGLAAPTCHTVGE